MGHIQCARKTVPKCYWTPQQHIHLKHSGILGGIGTYCEFNLTFLLDGLQFHCCHKEKSCRFLNVRDNQSTPVSRGCSNLALVLFELQCSFLLAVWEEKEDYYGLLLWQILKERILNGGGGSKMLLHHKQKKGLSWEIERTIDMMPWKFYTVLCSWRGVSLHCPLILHFFWPAWWSGGDYSHCCVHLANRMIFWWHCRNQLPAFYTLG